MDLRNTVRNGVLYLQDPVEKRWNSHFFVLTRNKLFYTECVNGQNDQETEDDTDTESETSNASSTNRPREVRVCECTSTRVRRWARGSFDNLKYTYEYVFSRVYQTTNYITEKNGFTVNYQVVETKLKTCFDITRISEMERF